MEKNQFIYLMTRLAIAFKEDIDPERFNIYSEFLINYNYDLTLQAIDDLISSSKWFPKISEIIDKITPKDSKEKEYLRYLERKTEEARQITWNETTEDGKRQAKKLMDELKERWEKEETEGQQIRNKEFESNRKRLQKQAKLFIN